MGEIVIGDMHFGVKSNSVEWLTKQCRFLDTQLISEIRSRKPDRVVFLGDVFDVRYSINQQVASEVKRSMRNVAQELSKIGSYLVFIAGNHDYYSPLEEASRYNAYETVFGDEFLKVHNNVHFVTDTPKVIDDSLFLPWYWTENVEHFDDILYRYDMGTDIKAIYCHADLSVWPGPRVASLKGIPVYSGHIHFIVEDTICNLHNIGAACALTFADTNEDRYMYWLEDFKIVEKIPNRCTPKFIKLYDEDIFNTTDDIFDNSFVQLCISRKNIELATYIDRIKMLKSKYVDANIRVHLTDSQDSTETNLGTNIDLSKNISEYIHDNIPDKLKSKYEMIRTKIL